MLSWYIEANNEQSDQSWFPDLHYQELLLPYLGTGKVEIDAYGRTAYGGEELDRLLARLQHHYDYFEAMVFRWEIVRTDYYSADKQNGSSTVTNYLLERETILRILDTLIDMIEEAKRVDGSLVFLGD